VVCLNDGHGVWVVPFSQCFNVDHRGKVRIDFNSYEMYLHKSRIAVQRRQRTPSLRTVHNDESSDESLGAYGKFVPGEHCTRQSCDMQGRSPAPPLPTGKFAEQGCILCRGIAESCLGGKLPVREWLVRAFGGARRMAPDRIVPTAEIDGSGILIEEIISKFHLIIFT
jgi:hypothetical protein